MPRFLPGRLLLLAAILSLDALVLASVPHSVPLLGSLAPCGIVALAVFLGMGFPSLCGQRDALSFDALLFLGHLACIGLITACNLAQVLKLDPWFRSSRAHLTLHGLAAISLVLLAAACVPLMVWKKILQENKFLCMYSALAGGMALCLRGPLQSGWDASRHGLGHQWVGEVGAGLGRAMQSVAFDSVQWMLRIFLRDIQVNPDTFTIGTPHFAILVARQCSGMEGLGLVLAFTAIWLWYYRKESRFPQAFLLVPCALGSVWVLNILRISALVIIGNAGYGEVAMVGFHSQAGWIAFTSVALGFSLATRRLSWMRKYPQERALATTSGSVAEANLGGSLQAGFEQTAESPATASYLVPFLAILAASFVSKACSGTFEWLYPLRFVAAAVALWFQWPELKRLNWRFGWLAPAIGAGVFVLWLIPSFWMPIASPLGPSLAALTPSARLIWIAFRIAAACVTVPIAEELAFRGYLARRLATRHFDSIPFSAITALSLGASSFFFGALHGQRWIMAIAAGLAYAAAMKWRGRLGDAIAAHATTNLLLAVWVLSRGDWAQW